jgi:hypothetical protein
LKKCFYPKLEEALLQFVSTSASNGLAINTVVLKEKANELAPSCGYPDFIASNGFIDRFKTRNEVIFQTIHGEANGVPEQLCDDWINVKLPELVKDFEPKDIFNGDEFGLFGRIPPNKSFINRGQKFKSGKKSKERVSVLICANSLGTEKLKRIVIGRSREPRCFRGKAAVPVVYKNNSNSWMTSEIFTEFLQNLNKKMRLNDRKIALIIDNCSAHPSIPLSNVKLIFLPPNATSRLQAMDMGVIHTLKSHYRQRLVRRMLALFETNNQFNTKDIDLYEAIIMLTNAWNQMNADVIKNCFRKSGLKSNETPVQESEAPAQESENISNWNELTEKLELLQTDFNDFVEFDDNIVVFDGNTETDVTENNQITHELNSDSDDCEEREGEEPIRLNDAIIAITQIRKYITQCNGSANCFELINKLENEIYVNKSNVLKQSKITDFMSIS